MPRPGAHVPNSICRMAAARMIARLWSAVSSRVRSRWLRFCPARMLSNRLPRLSKQILRHAAVRSTISVCSARSVVSIPGKRIVGLQREVMLGLRSGGRAACDAFSFMSTFELGDDRRRASISGAPRTARLSDHIVFSPGPSRRRSRPDPPCHGNPHAGE